MAVTSAKRVGELNAFSISESCLQLGLGNSTVTLWPNIAFLPRVLPRGHRNQPIFLARYKLPPAESVSKVLCSVWALAAYIGATAAIQQTHQLFMLYGGQNRGRAFSRKRLSHWIADTIFTTYRASGCALPAGLRCHSTREISTYWTALGNVPLEDICAAASWES